MTDADKVPPVSVSFDLLEGASPEIQALSVAAEALHRLCPDPIARRRIARYLAEMFSDSQP